MENSDKVRITDHLRKAWEMLHNEKPQGALQESINALKLIGGDAAVSEALQNFKKEVDTSQNCGSKNQQINTITKLMNDVTLASQKTSPDFSNSILAESGREEMNEYALEDGSCFLCDVCGDVVVSARKEAHKLYWCRKNNDDSNDSDDN